MNTDKDTVHRSGYLKVVDKPIPPEEVSRVKYTADGETQWHFDMAKELYHIVDDIYKWNDKMFNRGRLSNTATINRIQEEFLGHHAAHTTEQQLDTIGEISFFLVSAGWNTYNDHHSMRVLLECVTDRSEKPYVFDPSNRIKGMLLYEDLYYALIELVKAHKLTDKAYRDLLRAVVGGTSVTRDTYMGSLRDIANEHGLTLVQNFVDYSKPRNRLGFAPLVTCPEPPCEYHTNLCLEEAGKSTLENKAGCVLVDKNGHIVARGNSHTIENSKGEEITTQAEDDALIEVPYDRYALEGGAVYTTRYPDAKSIEKLKEHGTSYIVLVSGDPIETSTYNLDTGPLQEHSFNGEGLLGQSVSQEGEGPEGSPVFKKFDAGKPMYNLIPAGSLKRLAVILTHGADKYGKDNWKQCTDLDRYVSSLYRHLEAIRLGEKIDPDSGEPHTAHMLANAVFIDHLTNEGE